jgi:hypothetical protein
MALLENREPRVDYKIIQPAIGTVSIAVRDVMKSHADVYSAALGSKYANTAACLADKLELTRVFDRHGLVEVEKSSVDVCKRMDLRTVRKIQLQAYRCDSCTVSGLALKCVDTRNARRAARSSASSSRRPSNIVVAFGEKPTQNPYSLSPRLRRNGLSSCANPVALTVRTSAIAKINFIKILCVP